MSVDGRCVRTDARRCRIPLMNPATAARHCMLLGLLAGSAMRCAQHGAFSKRVGDVPIMQAARLHTVRHSLTIAHNANDILCYRLRMADIGAALPGGLKGKDGKQMKKVCASFC